MKLLGRMVSVLIVLTILTTCVYGTTFDDVRSYDSYYNAVEALNEIGVLSGDDDDGDGVLSFRPNDSITRAETAVIICRMQDEFRAVEQSYTVFIDVPKTHWASGYIARATNYGIVSGYGDGKFGPDDPVLYEEVVKMIMETLGYKPFASENGGYPTGYFVAARQMNVLDGVVDAREGRAATRAQVAQMMYNAIDTPLMQRENSDYVIFDGSGGRERHTLLNQYMGYKGDLSELLPDKYDADNNNGNSNILTEESSASTPKPTKKPADDMTNDSLDGADGIKMTYSEAEKVLKNFIYGQVKGEDDIDYTGSKTPVKRGGQYAYRFVCSSELLGSVTVYVLENGECETE